jgi:hypothetical protein
MSSNQKENGMNMICGTRAMKNAEHIKKVASHLISEKKINEITDLVPMETLQYIHTIDNVHDAIKDKELADVISKNAFAKLRDTASGPLFNGTIRFVRIIFNNTQHGTISVSDIDMQTILEYSNHAVVPISQYASQYGSNSIKVSSDVITFDVDLRGGTTFTDTNLRQWIRSIASANSLGSDSCVVILNPPGLSNVQGSGNILGYHNIRGNVPFCFCNIGSNLTLDDKKDAYAEVLTHEIAEMVVDPQVDPVNPEVCDACAGNCRNNWRVYFDSNNQFLGGSQAHPSTNPFPASAYFTTALVSSNFTLGGSQSCIVDPRGNDLRDACVYSPLNPSRPQ